jgi:ABC-type multidrug transport system fused ATPase/permease subunit
LARALISRAPVLLLDELTASLDGETELQLVRGLDRFIDGRTAIVVTHRLSTAHWADRVALLENGIIQEAGPSGQQLKDSPRFARLFGDQGKQRLDYRSQ